MTLTLEQVSTETAQALVTQATAAGLSVDGYLQRLLGVANGTASTSTNGKTASVELDQFMADLEALSEGTEHLPTAPITYSREDIYFDHD